MTVPFYAYKMAKASCKIYVFVFMEYRPVFFFFYFLFILNLLIYSETDPGCLDMECKFAKGVPFDQFTNCSKIPRENEIICAKRWLEHPTPHDPPPSGSATVYLHRGHVNVFIFFSGRVLRPYVHCVKFVCHMSS